MPDREKVVAALECLADGRFCACCGYNPYHDCSKRVARDALALLKEQETVVRCKDCKHATMTSDGEMCKYCEMDTDDSGYQREVYHDADWFCADGERRDDDD